jgi:nucleotide-binding universal stress UspA family protein
MNPVKKIVVGADFSEATEPLLQAATQIARAFEASVDVVHVRETFTYMMPEGIVPAIPTPEQQAAMDKWITESLDRFASSLRQSGITCATHTLDGAPAVQIVSYADKVKADMILVGTHGRGGLGHAILGSVAERVVQKAGRPVLVVPIGKR